MDTCALRLFRVPLGVRMSQLHFFTVRGWDPVAKGTQDDRHSSTVAGGYRNSCSSEDRLTRASSYVLFFRGVLP